MPFPPLGFNLSVSPLSFSFDGAFVSATAAPAGTALASSQPKGRLLRILGVSFGIAVIVGDTIGSGILRTPGEMPRWITHVNTGGPPTSALLVATVFSIALVLGGSFDTMVGIAAVLFVANYVSGFTSLFMLRRRKPKLAHPFKVWGYPWSNLAVLLVSAAFLVGAVVDDLKDALFTLVLIALVCPLYFLFIRESRVETPNVLIGTNAVE